MKRKYYCFALFVIFLSLGTLGSFIGISKAGTYPPYTSAFEGGLEPVIEEKDTYNSFNAYYGFTDIDRGSEEWAWTLVPGHRHKLLLHVDHGPLVGCKAIISEVNGPLHFVETEKSLTDDMYFTFTVNPAASPSVVNILIEVEYSLVKIAAFRVYGVIGTNADEKHPSPIISLVSAPESVIEGEEFSVTISLKNSGTDPADIIGSYQGSGLTIHVTNGFFTKEPTLEGFQSSKAYDEYDDSYAGEPQPRDFYGAPIIEVYDAYMDPGATDRVTVYVKATGSKGESVEIRCVGWMPDPDERLYNTMAKEDLKIENLYFRNFYGSKQRPFNGEWGGTSKFDNIVRDASPIKKVLIKPSSFEVHLRSSELDGPSSNLGQIRFDNTLYSLPTYIEKEEGIYSAEFLAPEGYKFKQWVTSGDISVSSGTSNPTQVNINGDGTLRAIYVKVYKINVLPNGGEIIVDDKESVVISKKTYYWEKGSEHTLEAVSVFYPENDLKLIFTRWSDGYTNRRRTIIITGDANYRAEWDVQYKVNIEVSPSGGGTTDPSPDTYWCDENSRLTVTAIPASGYSFSHWIVDDETFYTNPIDIQIDEPHTLTAVFTENPTLIVQTNPSLAGIHFKIDGADYYTSYDGSFTTELEPGSHTIELIDTIKIEDENTKYEFSHWSEAASGSQNPVIVEITSDDYLTAIFDTYYKVSFTQAGVEQGRPVVITVDGEEHSGYTIYTYDKWILNGGYVSFEISSIIESSVTGKRYVFDHWEDSEGYTVTSPQMIDEPEVFTAYYTIEYRLEASTIPDGLTAPQIHPSGPWYAEGTEVTCTAAQIEGYEFDYWILDGKPQEAGNTELTVTMDSPHQAIAHYTPVTTETWIFPVQIGTETYHVAIESNSTVSNFYFDEDEGTLTFQVEGASGTKGFCEVVVPTALMQNPFTVKIDGATILENHYAPTNGTHYFIQFTYIHTTHTIEIIPEITPTTILFLTAVLTLTTIAFVKKKTIKH